MSKSLLRFMTCGSVDDGKSTLIGRLLADTGNITADRLAAAAARADGTGTLDYSSFVDGLEAEREQGITIDVCHRYFSTRARAFIAADTPGHVQYTRNMASAASISDAAILLVDARLGLTAQTRRHAAICSLMGIKSLLLVVNKMDLVGHGQSVFTQIEAEFAAVSRKLGFYSTTFVAAVATTGEGVSRAYNGDGTWYQGSNVLEWLETIDPGHPGQALPFRMPVQGVIRSPDGRRLLSGTIASGSVTLGDALFVANSGMAVTLAGLNTPSGPSTSAGAGQAVTLELDQHVDAGSGALIAAAKARPEVSDQFAAEMIWLGDHDALPGRSYIMRIGTQWTTATITSVRHQIDPVTLEPVPARSLEVNSLSLCHLSTGSPIAFDPFEARTGLGSFILVDRMTNDTVAAGTICYGLRRASNIHLESGPVTAAVRGRNLGQRPVIAWLTGLSGSGKSTIAKATETLLNDAGLATYLLDGDNLRHGLNRDLGFTDADRVENLRRAGHVGRLMVDAGLVVLAAFISPFRRERQMLRELFPEGRFIEVFVDASLESCERRDPKGLYAKARSGALSNMTGLDSPYEAPAAADLVLTTDVETADVLAERLAALILSLARPVD